MIGKTISHYKILEKLGEGGMGVVYKAVDETLRRAVALKFLSPRILGTEEHTARLMHEARAAAALDHQNICTVHEVSEEDGQPFIVMSLIEGESLRERMKREPLTGAEAIEIVSQAAAGLAAAHEVGVIHRDINPRNIMITPKGQVKIMDFGLAVSSEMTKLTQPGKTAGTTAYMSPEQARGIGVDHRTDIWALGVVLHEIATGRRAFKGDSDQAVIYSILNEDPPLPSKLRPELPSSIDAVVSKAIAKKAEDRYQSMEELLQDLRALAQGEEVTATIPARVRRHGTSRFARPWVSWLGLAAIAALVVVTLRTLLPLGSATEELIESRVLVTPFENRTRDPSLDHIGERVAASISEGLAKEGLAEVLPHSEDGFGGGEGTDTQGFLVAARQAGAGILVAGSFRVLSDSLHIDTRVLDVSDGKVLNLIPDESGPLAAPAEAIAKTRSRVMGALAARLDPSVTRDALAHAPTWEAYQAYRAGSRSVGAEALEHLARAAELDPAFTPVRLPQTKFLMDGMYLAEADSLVRGILSRPGYLTPDTRLAIEAFAARKRGDYAEELRKLRELIRVEPQLPWVLRDLTYSALRVNRPHEVIEMCKPLLEEARERDDHAQWWVYYRLSDAYHRVGEFERQLEIARDAVEAFPDALGYRTEEVCALAGLGRAEEIHRIVEEAASTPVGGEAEMSGGWSQYPAFELMLTAVEELKAHGHTEDGAAVAEDLLEWQERRTTGEGDTLESRFWLATPLARAERWEEALAIVEELERVGYDARLPTLDDVEYRGRIGVLAARLGDRERALEVKSALLAHDEPYMTGHDSVYATQWAACIASVLGEHEEAMELLNAAMACGSDFWWYLHRDPDLQPMRDYPPFQRLLEPRG